MFGYKYDELNGYYLRIEKYQYFIDIDIAKYLGLSLTEYHSILIKFNAYNLHDKHEELMGSYYFNNKEDCQKVIDYLNENLDSFLMMKELTQ